MNQLLVSRYPLQPSLHKQPRSGSLALAGCGLAGSASITPAIGTNRFLPEQSPRHCVKARHDFGIMFIGRGDDGVVQRGIDW